MRTTRATAALEAIAGLAGDVRDPLELLEEVRVRMQRVVPNAGGAWMVTDPQTILPTGFVKDGPFDLDLHRRFYEHELFVPDISAFADLHRTGAVATTLADATHGRLEISARHRLIHEPAGLGDEVRMLFRTGEATWGMACLSRAADEPDFDADEVAWMRSVAPHVGRGLRAALAVAPPAEPIPAMAPGMLVLDEAASIEYVTGEAERWLAVLPRQPGMDVPAVVFAVALQARAEALAAVPAYAAPAQARVRLDTGAWLYVHASALRDARGDVARIAVMLEPADRAQLLPLLAHVHGLTERERELTGHLLSGLPTEEIASRMGISRHTVRDHVKAVFAKVGVASRPELTARFLPV